MDSKTIVCPHCGAEYRLSEIFYPDDLIGKVNNIVKDDSGKIILLDEEEPVLEQLFCCEYCDKSFVVKASLSVKAEDKEEIDFTEEF